MFFETNDNNILKYISSVKDFVMQGDKVLTAHENGSI